MNDFDADGCQDNDNFDQGIDDDDMMEEVIILMMIIEVIMI
jgi:hypothetical protein